MTTIKEGTRTTASETATARGVDMKFEIVVIPVSDVDRAKRFYGSLGWRLDADFAAGDDWRGLPFPPPRSPASVIFRRDGPAPATRRPRCELAGLVRRLHRRGAGRQAAAVLGSGCEWATGR